MQTPTIYDDLVAEHGDVPAEVGKHQAPSAQELWDQPVEVIDVREDPRPAKKPAKKAAAKKTTAKSR